MSDDPLLFVYDDDYRDMETGHEPAPTDPWCTRCGARVADGVGIDLHASFHDATSHRMVGQHEFYRQRASEEASSGR